MSKEDFDERVKVILLGDSAVGKTCLLLRYAEKSFKRTWVTTIGIDYKFRCVVLRQWTVPPLCERVGTRYPWMRLGCSWLGSVAVCSLCAMVAIGLCQRRCHRRNTARIIITIANHLCPYSCAGTLDRARNRCLQCAYAMVPSRSRILKLDSNLSPQLDPQWPRSFTLLTLRPLRSTSVALLPFSLSLSLSSTISHAPARHLSALHQQVFRLERQAGEARDLGHGRTGAVPDDHDLIHSWCRGRHAMLRRDEQRELHRR